MLLFVPSGRSSRIWLSASLALVAQGCVFHPPPPLPEELAAQKAAEEEQRAAARRRDDRYDSAAALGDDIRRYLDNEPLHRTRATALAEIAIASGIGFELEITDWHHLFSEAPHRFIVVSHDPPETGDVPG